MFLFFSLELTRQFSYAVHWSPSIPNSNDFSIGGGTRRTRGKKTYFISSRHLPASISFELTNWVNLSIIFDLFGVAVVCTNDGGLPQTMFLRRKLKGEQKKKVKRKLSHLLLPRLYYFPDQTNTRGRKKRPDKRCIKWIYIRRKQGCFWKSCPKCVMKIEPRREKNFDPYSSSHIRMRKTSFVWLINVTLCSFYELFWREPHDALGFQPSPPERMIIGIKRPYKEAIFWMRKRKSFYAFPSNASTISWCIVIRSDVWS